MSVSEQQLCEATMGMNYENSRFSKNDWREYAKDLIRQDYESVELSYYESQNDPSVSEEDKVPYTSFDDYLKKPETQQFIGGLYAGNDCPDPHGTEYIPRDDGERDPEVELMDRQTEYENAQYEAKHGMKPWEKPSEDKAFPARSQDDRER